MDVVERLTLEAAQADTMLASEHRQRYEFAATLAGAQRVLDLCCGSGYGSRILSASAGAVVGVDNDAATVETAQATLGRAISNLDFELADAIVCLARGLDERFDVIVCFEGLEHLHELERALTLLRAQAESGLRLIVSVPNGKLFHERNPYHVTEFGYDDAMAAFDGFPATVMVPQFLAEGSVICPAQAQETEVTLAVDERREPEYANHFIFCVNFAREEVQRVHHGRMQLSASPVFNRWSEDLKRGAWALRRENARLARARLGKSGSAAAAALVRVSEREATILALEARATAAEARAAELEERLRRSDPTEQRRQAALAAWSDAVDGAAEVTEGIPAWLSSGEDPNSWEQRRHRAASVLVPWIEQTIPLTGKTVLEYGCGNAAVTCAIAQRAQRVIGVDIDPDGIELGLSEIRSRGLNNVELECHPLDSILDAVAARRGEVDVVLLYAVLEHLTLDERLAVLRLARDVVKPDGAIVVCETPNRLTYFDHHTAQMPFFHLLPDQLAAEYYPRSERADFTAALTAAQARGPQALLEATVRWGRGVSFHEFELVFSDGLDRHVLASNYDPLLFSERPVHPEEMILARYLERQRPDLAPVWSRAWLDVILSPQPIQRRPSFLRPWTADTATSSGVSWTRWENLYVAGPESTLSVDLPHPSQRLVVGTVAEAGPALGLLARPVGTDVALRAVVETAAPYTAFTTFRLPEPAARIMVAASRPCHVVFVGYDD
jgi:2-polyprenyl-3-methyl-5-hydroxy-6-metoxy-1,4-benzoquinol methylase